jgi:hypothetical protein
VDHILIYAVSVLDGAIASLDTADGFPSPAELAAAVPPDLLGDSVLSSTEKEKEGDKDKDKEMGAFSLVLLFSGY